MGSAVIDQTFFPKVARRISRLINSRPWSPTEKEIEDAVRDVWRKSPVIEFDVTELGDQDKAIVPELYRRICP